MSRVRRGYSLQSKEIAYLKDLLRTRSKFVLFGLRAIAAARGRENYHLQRQMKLQFFFTLQSIQLLLVSALFVDVGPNQRVLGNHRSLNDFSDRECFNFMKFQKSDIGRLVSLLRLDANVHYLENGIVCDGEEVLIVGLFRLCNVGKYDLFVPLLGIFHYFINYMIANFKYLLMNRFFELFWEPRLCGLAKMIQGKLRQKYGIGVQNQRVCMFIDCTVIATCRPGSGPAADGPNANRKPNFIQMAFYSRHKK